MIFKCLLVILTVAILTPVVCVSNQMYAGVTVALSGKVYPVFSFTVDHSTPTYANQFRPGEMHHLYLGAAMLFVHHRWARAIGAVLVTDDLSQHLLRVTTPIHLLSDQLGTYHWYRELNQRVNF